ncbi:MAG: hypothetical protein QNJ72_02915 [Pleurocapsa sp. MO_226.B13]|nr:hypothetical protein [Pleurocapsa sp. MO_226.B13]
MRDAQWDALEIIMHDLATWYPESFTLTQSGDCWTWENKKLNLKDTFTFLDESTLPYEPLNISPVKFKKILFYSTREKEIYLWMREF